MQIRPFTETDRNAVIAVWIRSGLTRPWNDPGKDIDRKLSMQGEWFLVGEVDDVIVATVMIGYDGHRGWINYLAVDPDFQGRGFGRILMNEAEHLLLEVNCPKINLQIRHDNLGAIAFYERIGYAEDAVVSYGKRLIPDS